MPFSIFVILCTSFFCCLFSCQRKNVSVCLDVTEYSEYVLTTPCSTNPSEWDLRICYRLLLTEIQCLLFGLYYHLLSLFYPAAHTFQHPRSYLLRHTQILILHTQTVPQQHTNKDGKAIWEPKCLQFSFGCWLSDTRREASAPSGEEQFTSARFPSGFCRFFCQCLALRSLAVFICGLSLAHFAAAGQWAALLISCLDAAGYSLNEGL